jgi:hypothetical protein
MRLTFKRFLAIALLLPGIAVAQDFFTVPADTRFPVELHQTVRASHAKVGDPVEFRTIEPTLIGNGVVVPEGAELLGEVAFVRSDRTETPPFWVRLRVYALRWDTGRARINAVVDTIYYVRSSYLGTIDRRGRITFLEGIHVDPHLFRNASTDFFSDSKEVILHSGILLQFRHIVPDDEAAQTLSASSGGADAVKK